jgi:hypothetical protein
MSYHCYESDAAYFDLVAQSADPKDRKRLRQVAAAYRAMAKKPEPDFDSRRAHWSHRAATCRAMIERFESPVCRTQLLRLAETYDLLAGTCGEGYEPAGSGDALAAQLSR